jgi:pimeloyl-ACP methyl ester carboxylesterase
MRTFSPNDHTAGFTLSYGCTVWRLRKRSAFSAAAVVLLWLALSAPAAPLLISVHLIKSDSSPLPSSCGADGSGCREMITFASGGKLEAYRNFPFSGSSKVSHAVIVIHGTGRNAAHYYANMLTAATQAGVVTNTLVLAPFFKTSQDSPGGGQLTWTSGGWKIGDAAESKGVSSFSVMDDLITTLANKTRFPNLKWITVTGHSAGGQFTQRYAAFGVAPNYVRDTAVDFVVANPSSYTYFDNARPTRDGSQFSVPVDSSCRYDDYKYGLGGRTGYVAKLSPRDALRQFASRRITYLSGGADSVQNGDMDTDCGAMAQGPNRVIRSAYFFERIKQLAPDAPQQRVVVPGVAHDSDGMYQSAQARPVLFGVRGDIVGARE